MIIDITDDLNDFDDLQRCQEQMQYLEAAAIEKLSDDRPGVIVTMLTTSCSPEGSFKQGRTYKIKESIATSIIKTGLARYGHAQVPMKYPPME